MTKSFWFHLFLIVVGIVVGSMVSEMTADIPALSWLSYGLNFGTKSPVVLDLNAITLTLGISLKVTVSTAACVALSLVLGRYISEK
ncbi:MAG: DUF4321 domain-containing protein [Clostridia bacterium]|nr:DUF4321 domain-containing protein [Clostridia bacterium]MBQ9995710.1 DUF4321 domain-containing protein [Clostridia bacterium]